MINQATQIFRTGWALLRIIAVISSSMATILSSLLPLYLHSAFSTEYLVLMLIFLSVGALIIHGLLTHLFNDYTDFRTGTDAHSPAILSGGSRVIQKGLISPKTILKLGIWISVGLLSIAIFMLLIKRYELTILILLGLWGATSYSLPPFLLSYRPFLGEWLSLFPSIFFIGLAGPWLILNTVPLWAIQNALINALVCMAWVMVHHIPDIDADQMAIPTKQTTVVWFANKFGLNFARIPALLYITMAGLLTIWLFPERFFAGLISIGILLFAFMLVMKMEVNDDQHVSDREKVLLLLAIMIAIVLGVF